MEVQVVQCLATAGSFVLTFRDARTSAIAFNANSATVQAALNAVSTVGQVQVALLDAGGATMTSACSAAGTTVMVVTFVTALGDLPSLVGDTTRLVDSVNGNGQLGSGTLVVKGDGAVLQGQTSVMGTRENAFCSNHGACDFTTGMCVCDEQYASSDGKGGPGTIGDCGYHMG